VTTRLDETHRADLSPWVESAARPGTDFPVQNLPLGCFRAAGRAARPGIAIGDEILDLATARTEGLLSAETAELVTLCVAEGSLNPLFAAGGGAFARLRQEASRLLRGDTAEGVRARALRERLLVPIADAELLLPARVGDYTDF
jgi:fumarylacetoacetase